MKSHRMTLKGERRTALKRTRSNVKFDRSIAAFRTGLERGVGVVPQLHAVCVCVCACVPRLLRLAGRAMLLRSLGRPVRWLSTQHLDVPSEVLSLIKAEPSAEAMKEQALGCLSGVHERLPQLRSALTHALGYEANAVHVSTVLRALVNDTTEPSRSRARAAMMLYHHHKERGEYDKCLMAAVTTKMALEEAFGTTKTVEYASALGAQAQAAERLGQHTDAAQLMQVTAQRRCRY